MSPSVLSVGDGSRKPRHQRPSVFIYGISASYPPHTIKPEELDVLARRFYSSTPALEKVLTINAYTGIDSRSSIGTIDHPLVNAPTPPTITELNDIFMTHGVSLSVSAARKALAQSNTPVSEITHVISTTCTNSANPGYDHFVAKRLGLNSNVQKVLLHGIGCSGGMAALRTAAGLIMGESFRGKKARVLVLATEISTSLVRSELESIVENEEVRIGVCLFSDCASALVVGNVLDIEEDDLDEQNGNGSVNEYENGRDDSDLRESHPYKARRRKSGENEPLLELMGWEHEIIEDTEKDLGFDVDPLGWKVVLTPRVPSLTSKVLPPLYNKLVSSIPELGKLNSPTINDITKDNNIINGTMTNGHPTTFNQSPLTPIPPTAFAWALHPGGATILSGVERVMGLTAEEHLRESYEVYVSRGNSSSATWGSVLARMMNSNSQVEGEEKKRYVVGCAFGPGITVEMAVLRRLDLDGEGPTGRIMRRKTVANGQDRELVDGLERLDMGRNGSTTSGSSNVGEESSSTSGSGAVSGSGSGAMSPVEGLVAEDVD